jgi:hypothetical protein
MAIHSHLVPCPACRALLPPEVSLCPRCGADLHREITMNNPGQENISPNPGETRPTPMPTTPDEPQSSQNPRRLIDWLFWITAAILALTALGLFGMILYDRWQQQNADILEMTISPDDLPRGLNVEGPPGIPTEPAQAGTATPEQTEAVAAQLPEASATPGTTEPAPPGGEIGEVPQEAAGGQRLTSSELRDDFSTPLLGWSEAERDDSRRGYLPEGQYFIEVDAPGVFALSFLPVEFAPYAIEFSAIVAQDAAGGTYGVLCQYIDENNFYLVEFNPTTGELAVGERKASVYTAFTSPEWQNASGFNLDPGGSNRIAVNCSPTEILVNVNGQGTARLSVNDPLQPGSRMALFAAGYEGIRDGGFRVILDDVFARSAGPDEFR